MAWCCQATSHYLSQCWPRSMLPNGFTRPQWVNPLMCRPGSWFNIKMSSYQYRNTHCGGKITFGPYHLQKWDFLYYMWDNIFILVRAQFYIHLPSSELFMPCRSQWALWSMRMAQDWHSHLQGHPGLPDGGSMSAHPCLHWHTIITAHQVCCLFWYDITVMS